MDTLGIVDSRSIAAGAELADIMLKAAPVALVRASVVCAGRFRIRAEGDREAVETSVRAAVDSGWHLAGSLMKGGAPSGDGPVPAPPDPPLPAPAAPTAAK